MKKREIRKIVVRIMRRNLSSLESHLDYTYLKKLPTTVETNAFHLKCVEEYTDNHNDLLKLLK